MVDVNVGEYYRIIRPSRRCAEVRALNTRFKVPVISTIH